jgi:hypothetical protein
MDQLVSSAAYIATNKSTLQSGRFLHAGATDSNAENITPLHDKNKRTVIGVPDMENLEGSPLSLLPEEIPVKVSTAEIRDLIS